MNKHLLHSIVLMIALLAPAAAWAVDGKVAFGYFADPHHVRSRPDGGAALWRSEVEVGHKMSLLTGQIRPFVNLETLMDAYNGNGTFSPASIRYTVGIGWEKSLGRVAFFMSFEHFCWHPVDNGGTVEEANYIEVGFKF